MPTYRSITVSLVSQFDILTVPEYAPPAAIDATVRPVSKSRLRSKYTTAAATFPSLVNRQSSTVTVFVPVYPNSQFWLSYNVSPSVPPHAFYYFKLFIGGKHITSWGCGERDGYRGKTMFALFAKNGETAERRNLCFSPVYEDRKGSLGMQNSLMVKVYRAAGRRRLVPHLEPFGKCAIKQVPHSDVGLYAAGTLQRKHPRRYYDYALLDALDAPFATFQYVPRTWEELVRLGVRSPSPAPADESEQDFGDLNSQSQDDRDSKVVLTRRQEKTASCSSLRSAANVNAESTLHSEASEEAVPPSEEGEIGPLVTKHHRNSFSPSDCSRPLPLWPPEKFDPAHQRSCSPISAPAKRHSDAQRKIAELFRQKPCPNRSPPRLPPYIIPPHQYRTPSEDVEHSDDHEAFPLRDIDGASDLTDSPCLTSRHRSPTPIGRRELFTAVVTNLINKSPPHPTPSARLSPARPVNFSRPFRGDNVPPAMRLRLENAASGDEASTSGSMASSTRVPLTRRFGLRKRASTGPTNTPSPPPSSAPRGNLDESLLRKPSKGMRTLRLVQKYEGRISENERAAEGLDKDPFKDSIDSGKSTGHEADDEGECSTLEVRVPSWESVHSALSPEPASAGSPSSAQG